MTSNLGLTDTTAWALRSTGPDSESARFRHKVVTGDQNHACSLYALANRIL